MPNPRWTNVVVEIDGFAMENETSSFQTNKHTHRCTVLYKVELTIFILILICNHHNDHHPNHH